MTLQDSLDRYGPNQGELQVIRERRDSLYRQLSHVVTLYEFFSEYEQLDIQPDPLHKRLFQETSFTVRSFKNRMTRAGHAFEVIGKMLQSDEYYSEIREEVSQHPDYVDLEEGQISDIITTDDEDINTETVEGIVRDAADRFSEYHDREDIYEMYSNINSELFEEAASHLNKMGEWYESALLEEGFIEEGEERTPSLLALFALCGVYLTSLLCIAIGYQEEDAFKIMTGCNMLCMGILAFLAL